MTKTKNKEYNRRSGHKAQYEHDKNNHNVYEIVKNRYKDIGAIVRKEVNYPDKRVSINNHGECDVLFMYGNIVAYFEYKGSNSPSSRSKAARQGHKWEMYSKQFPQYDTYFFTVHTPVQLGLDKALTKLDMVIEEYWAKNDR